MWYWIQCRTVCRVKQGQMQSYCDHLSNCKKRRKLYGDIFSWKLWQNYNSICIFFPLKNACKVCSFWRSPTKLFQWSIIQTQVGIIKKCLDINCTFLFTDLIKKCKTNTENTVMKYLPGPKHIKTSTITRYKNIQKAISTQFSCPVP